MEVKKLSYEEIKKETKKETKEDYRIKIIESEIEDKNVIIHFLKKKLEEEEKELLKLECKLEDLKLDK